MKKPQTKVVEISAPVVVEETTQPKGCATYTISADTRWGMLAMVALHRLVQEWGAPEGLRREVEGVMREFEYWEEDHRGDPGA